jgi:hypothetical protein
MAGTGGKGRLQMSPQAAQYIVKHGKKSYDAQRKTFTYDHWLGNVVLNEGGKVVTVTTKSKTARYIR